jgi:uncharacterized protein (DUF952 family)
MILHITSREQWARARQSGIYRGDTLESDGFIHCSNTEQAVRVANEVFRGCTGLVLLCIDPSQLRSEIRYEGVGDGERFPHVYGPVPVRAVVQVLDFEPGEDGTFALPMEIAAEV